MQKRNMNLIDFVYESNNSNNSEELVAVFLKFLSGFGIDRFMLGELSQHSTSEKENTLGILVNYPEEWFNHYMANNYVDYDPVYRKALSSIAPFTWDEVQNEGISLEARRVMDEAREFKLCCGIGVSVHQTSGRSIGIGFAGSENGVRCDKDALSMIHLASHQLVMVYSDLADIKIPGHEGINITEREREVLLWIALGKTKASIAEILSVSESCVKRHCENIFRKLGTNNLPSSVARAISMGIINPF